MRIVLAAALLAACTGTPAPAPDAEPAAADKAVQATQAEAITVEDAWVRAVPPGTPNSAMFATLHNGSSTLVKVTGGSSAASEIVELHTHTQVDGQMRMRKVEAFDVPGNDHHHLAPGADHVMLLTLKQGLAEGASVDVTLTFADGSEKVVTATVKPFAGMGKHQHGGGMGKHGGGMGKHGGGHHGPGHHGPGPHAGGHGHEHTHADGETHAHPHRHDGEHGHDAQHDHDHPGPGPHHHGHGGGMGGTSADTDG